MLNLHRKKTHSLAYNNKLKIQLRKKRTKLNRKREQSKKRNNSKDDIGDSDGEIKCEYCEKTFKNSSRLKQHQICHSQQRPHACIYCDRRFKLKHQLATHVKRHLKDYVAKCEVLVPTKYTRTFF
nr:unnamed protein product [Callosobruchus analis]